MPLVAQPFTPTNVQCRVLAYLAKAGAREDGTISDRGSMNRNTIMDKVFAGNSVNLRPILEPLVEAKLISQRVLDIDGRPDTVFCITAAGRRAVENAPPGSLVPGTKGSAEHAELPPVGETFSRIYNGQEIEVTVLEGGQFGAMGQVFTSLSATAKAVRREIGGVIGEVNGWDFFGFTK